MPIHPICHAMLHRGFSNAELAASGKDVEALRRQERLSRFLRWIVDKTPEVHASTRKRRQ